MCGAHQFSNIGGSLCLHTNKGECHYQLPCLGWGSVWAGVWNHLRSPQTVLVSAGLQLKCKLGESSCVEWTFQDVSSLACSVQTFSNILTVYNNHILYPVNSDITSWRLSSDPDQLWLSYIVLWNWIDQNILTTTPPHLLCHVDCTVEEKTVQNDILPPPHRQNSSFYCITPSFLPSSFWYKCTSHYFFLQCWHCANYLFE